MDGPDPTYGDALMAGPANTKTKVRLGKICYTNCLPFYHNLQLEGDFEYFDTHPSRLNHAMRQGKLDMGPMSSLEYLNNQKEYLVLPGFAIGSRDFSGSVLLFSKEKIEGLNQAKIALTRHSLSSAALLRVLLKLKYKFENEFTITSEGVEEALEQHMAALAIGDEALFHQPKTFRYKYDLSEIWWNWTEKPFCFALWAVRKSFARENPDMVRHFCRRLSENFERNISDIEGLLKSGMNMDFLDVQFSKVFGYLFNLTYKLDESMLEGLDLFYRLTRRIGISPQPKKIEFFDWKP